MSEPSCNKDMAAMETNMKYDKNKRNLIIQAVRQTQISLEYSIILKKLQKR